MEKEGTNSSRWLWLTLVVVVLVAIGFFGWYYLNKNKNVITTNTRPTGSSNSANISTADWKEYVNTFYDFSVKYPANYSAKSQLLGGSSPIDGNGEDPNIFIYKTGEATPIFSFMSDGQEKNTNNVFLQDVKLSDMPAGVNNLDASKFNVSSTTLLGKSATKISVDINGLSYDYYFIPQMDNETWRITVNSSDSTANTILSTFQSTANLPVITPKSWQNYLNDRAKYTFSYPSSDLATGLTVKVSYPSNKPADSKDEDMISFSTKSTTYGILAKINVKEDSIEKWITTSQFMLNGVSPSTYTNLLNYTKTTVGGQTAYTSKDHLSTYVMNSANKNVYLITAENGLSPEQREDPIYQHILSGFQFTK